MKNRKTYIPITLAEFTNVTQSFSTSLEQIEYLAVTILGLQKKLKLNRTNENDDNELILEMIKFAENEIKNLGERPVKWIKYPLVTNVHDYNELKGRLKDDGKLLEWVKFLYNNIERSDQEHDGILGWRFNDRVLRQAELDSIKKDEDDDIFSQLLWEALDVEDDFVEHLERQLKSDIGLLPLPPSDRRDTVIGISHVQDTTHEQFFSDKKIHALVLRTMRACGTNWNTVKRNLSKNTVMGEKIKFTQKASFEGEMRPLIQFFVEGYPEPFEVMESTFKKTLTIYRKHLRKITVTE